MGDRANVYVKEGDTGVHLYTHWGGHELPETLRSALKRGSSRWDDGAYLTRIIFCEMVSGQEQDTTGFGISVHMQDNEYDVIVVDPDEGAVSIGSRTWSFQEYVEQEQAEWPQ